MTEVDSQREGIRRLISLYCDAVIRRDAEAVRPLFTPDACVVIAGGQPRIGGDEIVAGLGRTIAGFEFLHQKCDTGLIDLEGDRARSRLHVMECNKANGAAAVNLIFGIYEDSYARKDGIWRFQTRNFTMQFRAVVPAETVHFQDFSPAFPLVP